MYVACEMEMDVERKDIDGDAEYDDVGYHDDDDVGNYVYGDGDT